MRVEIEWIDPKGEPAGADDTLDLGREWPAAAWLSRTLRWPARPPGFGRIALAPVTLVALLTFGPSGPGPMIAGGRTVPYGPHGPVTWTCTLTGSAAADTAADARNLRGSLLAEQVQFRPNGTTCVSETRPGLP